MPFHCMLTHSLSIHRPGTLKGVPCLAGVSSAAASIRYKYLFESLCAILWVHPGAGVAGEYGNGVCYFLKNCFSLLGA